MLVTLSGIVMLVRARKSANALSGIWIVPSGILILLTLSWMLYSGSQEISTSEIIRVKSVKLVQFENMFSPKLVTLSGMVMLVRLVQRENASLSMLVTLSGILMLVRLVQSRNA